MTMSRMKPNAARMWDYAMGGSHNFAIDRATVKLVRRIFPIYEESLQAQRRLLKRAMTYMVHEKQLDKFLDFGSGLPTRGNVHEIVLAINPEARIIYSDSDPLIVAFGQDILKGIPNVRYIHCDVTELRSLFDAPVLSEMVGKDHCVGIGFFGVAVLIPDEPLACFFETLYEWADKGSHIAVTFAAKQFGDVKGMGEASRAFGIRFFARSSQEILNLITPWKLTKPGLVPGLYWGLPQDAPEVNEAIRESSFSLVAFK